MKTAIIIGPNSMLGSELARQLTVGGIAVIRAGRHDDCHILVDLETSKKPVYNTSTCADVIFHCASAFFPDTAEGVCRNLYVNAAGCGHVFQMMEQSHCRRIIYAGTIFSIPGCEDTGLTNSYGFSKAQGEEILEWGVTARQGVFCSLRFGQLWDTEGRCCAHQPWFGRIVAYASRGLDLSMPASLGPRNFLHVTDAARLMIRVAQNGVKGRWPVVHPESIEMIDLARAAYEVFNQGGNVRVDSTKQPFRHFHFPNDYRIYEKLDYQPLLSPIQGLVQIHKAGTAYLFGPLDVL